MLELGFDSTSRLASYRSNGVLLQSLAGFLQPLAGSMDQGKSIAKWQE